MVEIKVSESQLNDLQKLSFVFYLGLARGKEPLTYSFVGEDGSEHQVEVNVEICDEDNVVIEITFDSAYRARFDKSVGTFYKYILNKTNNWQSIE